MKKDQFYYLNGALYKNGKEVTFSEIIAELMFDMYQSQGLPAEISYEMIFDKLKKTNVQAERLQMVINLFTWYRNKYGIPLPDEKELEKAQKVLGNKPVEVELV